MLATCATTTACVLGTNTNTGPGVRGVSAHTDGVQGNSTAGGYGVRGVVNGSGLGGVIGVAVLNPGVTGQSTQGAGVSGVSSSGVGARGTSSSGIGAEGISTSNFGVEAVSTNSIGTYTTSSNYLALYAYAPHSTAIEGYSPTAFGVYGATASGVGVYGAASTGTGIIARNNSGQALNAATSSGLAVLGSSNSGNGGDFSGSYIGLIGRSNSFPLVLTDAADHDVFWVTGAGDVYYHGTLHTFATVRGGGSAQAYTPIAAAPTVEDTGTAQLVNGQAAVALDASFAKSIDITSAYRVFITPGGDTRGLFVAAKTPAGFVVRESQGGRSNVSFDYRIVASTLGHPGDRMNAVNATESAARVPSARKPAPATLPQPPAAVQAVPK